MGEREAAVSPVIRKDHPSGWWLPTGDSYFAQYLTGPAPKKNGFMREHLLEAYKHVRAWMVAVDCGAHVGFWSWDLAQQFQEVYAFEPSKASYECLLKNTAEFDNVKTYNVALGDRAGWCNVHNDKARPGNTGSNYILPEDGGAIPIVALDHMGIPSCDLLKVDVEGYELNVLRGAAGLIKTHRPVVIIECTDSKFRGRYDIPEGEAQRWLLKRGYREVAHMRPDKVFVP